MNQMFEHVSGTVFENIRKSGKNIDPASEEQMKVMSRTMLGQVLEGKKNSDSSDINDHKVDLGTGEESESESEKETETESESESDKVVKVPFKEDYVDELSSDEEIEDLRPFVDDLKYKLPVNIEEFYTGRTKKLAVTRQRISGKNIITEKKKIEVVIPPGSKNKQEIRFNKEGNEKFGSESGDIVITLMENSSDEFERIGNALTCVKNISLYESYAAASGDINVVIRHIDGSYIVIKNDGTPLHSKDGSRKVRNGGMPIHDKKTGKTTYGNLYIRFNVILPETFDDKDSMNLIERLFPVIPNNKDLTIYRDTKKNRFDAGTSKVREVQLEEITSEEKEQLEYEDESDSEDSDSSSDSE